VVILFRLLDKVFRLQENKTNVQTEVLAGVTTFMTMAYIIIVNPAILSVPKPNGAGMDFNSVMVATCIASAFATIFMGIYANYPFALAPGMGMNALFSFGICGTLGVPWEITLGIIFISGFIFVILTFLRIREMVVDAVPECIKYGTAAGIGIFIAFIGLKDAGIVTSHPTTFVTLGNLSSPPTLLGLGGLLFTGVLMARRVKGAIFWGMLATGLAGIPLNIVEFTGVFSPIPSIAPTFAKVDILGALKLEYIPPIFIFLFFIMFDTIGTLIGVGEQAGFMVKGKLPRVNQALLADATGAVVSSVVGTSPVTCYIESAAGVAEGGRTGLANIITGTLFISALFFSPITRMFGAGWHIPGTESAYLYPVTAPALIIVGSLMAQNIIKIKWQDFCEALPAFLTIIVMPLSFSISDGLAMGFISYPIIKLLSGRHREVHGLVYFLAILFIARYVFLR
jgi:AGZA family xanthine/uracil permease-like MFS transporter